MMGIATSDLERPWDVVVVGHGAAGLSAALSYLEEAPEGRTRVAVLDRAPRAERGGSSAWTTAMLRLDENAQLLEDWGELVRETNGEDADESYIEAFYENATDTLNWIRGHGVRVQKRRSGAPSPRFKYAYGVEGGGRSIVDTFSELVAARGGTSVYETEAIGLVRDGAGPVTGVRVRTADGTELTMPAGAVVMASGGFEGNSAMLAQHIPGGERLEPVAPGSLANRGEGIEMAVAVGAARSGEYAGAHIEAVDPRSETPEALIATWMYGILVDRAGNRFVDEASDTMDLLFDYVGNAVHRRAGGVAFAVSDAAVRRESPLFPHLNLTTHPPVVADTLEGLAEELGVDPAGLRATVDAYNAAGCAVPYDASVMDGKSTTGIEPPKSHWAHPLTEAPFEAWPVSPRICFTYGGIRVDGESRVLDEAGQVIPGLYAAGEMTGVFRHTYPSGTSVHRSLTFGRIAGRGIAARVGAGRVAGPV
jgi:tricarballylate dehydrogenase